MAWTLLTRIKQLGRAYACGVLLAGAAQAAPVPLQGVPTAVPAADINTLEPASSWRSAVGYPASHFANLWQRRRQLLRTPHAAEMRQAALWLDALLQAKRRAGWPDLPVYAQALSLEAENAAEKAAAEATEHAEPREPRQNALQLALHAVELAPHSLAPQLTYVHLLWRAGAYRRSWQAVTHVWHTLVQEPPLRQLALGLSFTTGLIALQASCGVFCLALLYRTLWAWDHWLQAHVLPQAWRLWRRRSLMLLLLCLPLLLRWGILGCCVVWLLLLCPFATSRERGVAAVLVALLGGVAAWLLPAALAALQFAGSPAQALYNGLRQMAPPATLAARSDATPASAAQLYVAGLRARWGGDIKLAKSYLSQAAPALPNDLELLAWLGNVQFLDNDVAASQRSYEQLLARAPQHLLGLYNLSVISRLQAQKRSQTLLQRALQLHPASVAKLQAYSAQTGLELVDPDVSPQLLRLTSVTREAGAGALPRLANAMWRLLGGSLPRWIWPRLAALWLLLLGVYEFWQRRHRLVFACGHCGVMACPRCESCNAPARRCGACERVFVARHNFTPNTHLQQEIMTHRFQAKVQVMRRWLYWLLPGGAPLLSQAPQASPMLPRQRRAVLGWGAPRGVLCLFIFFCSLIVWLGYPWLAPYVALGEALPLTFLSRCGLLLCVVSYLLSWLRGWREVY